MLYRTVGLDKAGHVAMKKDHKVVATTYVFSKSMDTDIRNAVSGSLVRYTKAI